MGADRARLVVDDDSRCGEFFAKPLSAAAHGALHARLQRLVDGQAQTSRPVWRAISAR